MIISTILLALIQAITEFLPISSSGHLILAREFLDFGSLISSLSFDVILHLGTLLAIIIYFRRDIKKIFLDLFKKDTDNNLFWNLAIATIPAITIGFVFADFIENSLRDSLVVVSNLVSIGVLFIIAEKFSRKDKDIETLGLNNSFLIGLAQSAALIPGVSRSGITIAIALLLGLKREDAARFSFLLAIPATALASLKGVYDLVNSTEQIAGLEIYLTGLVVSAVAGFFVIKYLLKYLKNNSLKIFAYYRFILAVIFFIIITL